ncbi:HD domain-containing protein [Evansella cellulosilytica]|uniref:Metal dependent phosphohydrolase n=1 Tax=Evansella cellulosilytica (strain ATCC 21833 / DSM 2522 / FERM P-1141 / JCM 9156 / N-4) TaxID=649639 RepID=E6TX71_EVAC2|nr:HD domain-containing protein [Evansella cellulosilytica]ADU31160.1 metal dependent phosphohydrolase [Evansella cellulosilytica DSM 2522]
MKRVTLLDVYQHPIAQKYITRSGLAHAISTAQYAFDYSQEFDVNPDLAVKAAFLHDIGHYTWYKNGSWDYSLYKQNDIHAIKGAERAHKLLIRLGENPVFAKKIALAILLHTDSYLPDGNLQLEPLQEVVALADKADEEPGGKHHYKTISNSEAIFKLESLDKKVEGKLNLRIS